MIYKGTRQSPFLLFTMDPEIQALIGAYQKRLADVTAQAIAFEARISIMARQIQDLTQQQPPTSSASTPSAPTPQKKVAKPKKVTDAGTF